MKALEVFWQNGFEGATISDLTEAMGITRPSCYATYGNKEDLFRKALDLYESTYMGFTLEALEAPTSREVAAAMMAGFVRLATDTNHPRGCLGTNGALACSTAAAPIKEELVRRRGLLEAALRRRLEAAKAAGDLGPSENVGDLARFVMAFTAGVAVQASSGASRASLERAASVALRAWPTQGALAGSDAIAADRSSGEHGSSG
jgi:AcrR family transcriptional regulator